MIRKRSIVARHLRLADQMQRDLAEIILHEIADARTNLVTLHHIALSPDFAHAKVWFTTLSGDTDAMGALLNRRANHLRALLFKRLHIHTMPMLHFIIDTTVAQAAEMSRLIEQANAVRAQD
jgi:ribosome-binding factor A